MTKINYLVACLMLSACALPRWPVHTGADISSGYGIRWRGISPEMHRGVDLALPLGTPVMAMMKGTVEFAGQLEGYGTVVIVRHANELKSVYAHLSRTSVKNGQSVKGKELLGLSGQSGSATEPQLHFEIWNKGKTEDPVFFLGGTPRQIYGNPLP